MSQEAAKGDAPGRLSPLKQADAKVQKICDQVKPQAEKMAGQEFPEFKATSYKTQVVAGINYFIKVLVGGPSYVHLRVFQSLPGDGSTLTLTAIKTGMTKDDPINYFD
ncbi:cystatin-A-like [Porites lutea]|uniref:cystatin-A-like n=1 Tax=Porites lutea TaxID=51062 RepID=UPI003CC583FA